jgi:hypothetical protein
LDTRLPRPGDIRGSPGARADYVILRARRRDLECRVPEVPRREYQQDVIMANDASLNTYLRLLLLHDQEIAGAKKIANRDSYADFFVEAASGTWQEAFTDSKDVSLVDKIGKERAAKRMAFVERLRRMGPRIEGEDGPYHDFFSDGPPGEPDWHEAWTEKEGGEATTRQLLVNPAARVRALSQLKVVQAYLRMRERSASPR